MTQLPNWSLYPQFLPYLRQMLGYVPLVNPLPTGLLSTHTNTCACLTFNGKLEAGRPVFQKNATLSGQFSQNSVICFIFDLLLVLDATKRERVEFATGIFANFPHLMIVLTILSRNPKPCTILLWDSTDKQPTALQCIKPCSYLGRYFYATKH